MPGRHARSFAVPLLLLVLGGGAAVPARADSWSARLVGELEYFGQNYRSEFDIPPLPDFDDESLRLVDTTRYSEDSWLPGQRLELGWESATTRGDRIELRSESTWNRERFLQEAEGRWDGRDAVGVGWTARLAGSLLDEERSLVGHGDWRVRSELRRAFPLAGVVGGIEAGWDHSSTRGDTTSFFTDYDRARLRFDLAERGGWLPRWEGYVEGLWKRVPRGLEGGYAEARAGARLRIPPFASYGTDLSVTWRSYEEEGEVGRDFLELEWRGRTVLTRSGSFSLAVDGDVEVADYRREDDLYYDFGELALFLPVEWMRGAVLFAAGPRARLQRDFTGGNGDFRQWTARAEIGAPLGEAGIANVGLEAGVRDYARESDAAIELSALSTTLLRSDFTLVEGFALLDVPLGAGFSAELLLDTALEAHHGRSERIWVTFANVGIARTFR